MTVVVAVVVTVLVVVAWALHELAIVSGLHAARLLTVNAPIQITSVMLEFTMQYNISYKLLFS